MDPSASQPIDAARLSTGPPSDTATPPSQPPQTSESSGSPRPVVLIATGDRLAPTYPDDKTVISKLPPTGDIQRPSAVTPQSIGASLVGKRLEHFDLVEFVGGGGMGAVFRATDTRLGRTVAVKVLSRDATDDDTIRRFKNEAQSAARLDHPNIARVHYVGEDHGWNFIVFEYIEGVNLRDMVARDGPLPLADALYYTLKVAEALQHSSARDVVHRDIKPSNVLVTADASVKLVDMGLARLHQVDSSSEDLTASGVTLGTFDYISPEQARDPRSADVRSDIYSLGCTLYFMLTSRPPFPDGTALQKLIRHSGEEPDDVRLVRPDLPPRVATLLARMLAKKPAQRQQSAQELVADVAALAEQLGLGSAVHRGNVVVAPPLREQPWWSRGLQVAVGAAMLLVAIFALDAWMPQTAGDNQVAIRPKLPPVAVEPEPTTPATASIGERPIQTKPLVVGPPPDRQSGAGTSGTEGSRSSPITPATNDTAANSAANVPAVVDAAADSGGELTGIAATDIGGSLEPPELAAEIRPDAADIQAVVIGPPAVNPPAPAVKIKRLVVDRELPKTAAPETEYVTSLAAACRRAADLALSEIELAWSGPLVESPLEITHPRLTLRAVSGYRPIVVFRPQVAETDSRRQMIRVSSGPASRLTILGLELRLELPRESAYGWSLLSLRPGQTLELADCVLTVQDGDGTRPPAHQQVAMIWVQPRMMTETMAMEPVAGMAAGTTVSIDRSIARGAATFLSLAEDSTLSLRWTQGLIVTPKRLLETTGSATSPKSLDRINLTLDSVTAACASGLFQMQRRSGAGYQFGLDVSTSHCILVTDPQAPLYEFLGVGDVTQSDLHCDGNLNRYSHPDVAFLRYGLGSRPDQVTTIDLKDRQFWSAESQPRPIDQWRTPPSFNRPPHEQTKEDFLLRPEVIIDAGFDPAALPSIQPLAAAIPRPAPPALVGPPPDSLNSQIEPGVRSAQ